LLIFIVPNTDRVMVCADVSETATRRDFHLALE